MIDYNGLLLTNVPSIVSFDLFLFVILTLIISFAIDMTFGELPGRIHPVVIIGSIIDFFKDIFIKISNKTSGLLVVLFVFGVISFILYLFYLIFSFNFLPYPCRSNDNNFGTRNYRKNQQISY